MEESGRGGKVNWLILIDSQIFWLAAESEKDFLRVKGLSLRLVSQGGCKQQIPRSDINLCYSHLPLVELVVL